MEWISVEDRLPFDYKSVQKFESCEVLVFCGGQVEFEEFTCGNLPEPWYIFGDCHKGMVTHWILKSDIEPPLDNSNKQY